MRRQPQLRRHLLAAACICGSAFLLTPAHSLGLGGGAGLGLGTDGGGLGAAAGATAGAGLAGSIGASGAGLGGTLGASAAVRIDAPGTRTATAAASNAATSLGERKAAAESRLQATAHSAKAFAMDRVTGAREGLTADASAGVEAQASGKAKASKQDRGADVNEMPQLPPRR